MMPSKMFLLHRKYFFKIICPFLSRITISDPILLYSLFHSSIGIGDNQSTRMKPERAKSIRPELLHCYIVIKRIHAHSERQARWQRFLCSGSMFTCAAFLLPFQICTGWFLTALLNCKTKIKSPSSQSWRFLVTEFTGTVHFFLAMFLETEYKNSCVRDECGPLVWIKSSVLTY